MPEASLPLTALSKVQRAQALQRFTIIRPALSKEVSQAQVARTHHLPPSTVQLRIKQYRLLLYRNGAERIRSVSREKTRAMYGY
jgi:hypothetical protein